MRRCKTATTEDPKAKHYMDVLLSSVEYETFVKLMRLMRPLAAKRMTEADAKETNRSFPTRKAEIDDGADFQADAKFKEAKKADFKDTVK
jgi:hypothetical protein